jgi:Mce-associated membrane protein
MATVAGRRRIDGDGPRERRPDLVDLVDLTADPASRMTEVLTHESGSESDETAELDGSDLEGTAPGVRRWRPTRLTAALAACLVALLVASALSLTMSRRDRADVSAGAAALASARTSAVTVLSYDYRQLDSDFAAATALTTGSLRSDYQATTSKAVAQLATQTHAVVIAKVVAGGVVSSTSTRVTVLLFVDQTTTSNRLDGPKVDQNRVQLVMQKVGSHWLVSGLKAL